MSSRQQRNTPCLRCRNKHQSCEWIDSVCCTRCQVAGIACSGPKFKTKPPCASCVRSSVRCVWDENGDICDRCKSHGSDICPLPPRAFKRRHHTNSSALSTTSPSQSSRPHQILDRTVNMESRRILAAQGILRLNAIGLQNLSMMSKDHPIKPVSGKLGEFRSVMYALSALRFANLSQVEPQKRSDENISNQQQVTLEAQSRQIQTQAVLMTALVSLYGLSWDIVNELPVTNIADTNDVRTTILIMQLAAKFRIQQGDKADHRIFRQLLAWSILLCAVHIKKESTSKEDKQELRSGAVQLATSEAYISMNMGVPSLIPPDTFELLCPRGPSAGESATDLQDMQPLIDIDDGPRGIFAEQYLWNQLLPNIINDIHHITRDTVTGHHQDNLARHQNIWSRMNDVYTWLDSVTFAISSSTRWNSDIIISQKAMSVLRTLFYTELCLLVTDVLYAKSVQRQISSVDFSLIENADLAFRAQKRINEGFERITRGLKLIMPSTPVLADLYQILDNVTFICSMIGDSLSEQAKILAQEKVKFLAKGLIAASFWDCASFHMSHIVGQRFTPSDLIADSCDPYYAGAIAVMRGCGPYHPVC